MENPFDEKDSKRNISETAPSKHEEGIAARMEKQLKAKSDRDGFPDKRKINGTHITNKDSSRGRH